MEYVNLGTTGMRVSRVCMGMMSFGNDSDRPWVLDEDAAEPIVRAAVEGGITFFDTADTYSGGASEVATGRLVGRCSAVTRSVVATKVFMPMTPGENGGGLSRKHILSAIDASLRRLDMDYVDLYQIHRWDRRTPIEETMGALHDVVRAGKARYIGASSMFAWQFAKAQYAAERQRLDPLRLDAAPLQPPLPGRGARDDPAVHRPGRRCHPLEPVGTWGAGRVTAPGRARGARPARGLDPFTDYLYSQPAGLRRRGSRGATGRRHAASRPPRWRLRGCCTVPVSPPRSWGPPSWHTSRTRWRPSSCRSATEDMKALEEPYVPHPVLGHV